MILIGSQRSGATALADHLLNTRDNDLVEVVSLDGFMSDDLHGALQEAQAIAQATQCKQYLFSLSLNPPVDQVATRQDFEDAADQVAEKLGLKGQPRAMVIHEKEGRRHAHVVWSRIDPEQIKAINLPFFKSRLRDVSRELYLDHGWDLPDGLQTYGGKSPLNFTLAEWQQAKRYGLDPREIKQQFRQAWDRSDSLIGLKNALSEQGYALARGDRRGLVAVDIHGEVYSLARYAGVKAKDVRAKCGNGNELPGVAETKSEMRGKLTRQMRSFICQFRDKQAHDMAPLMAARDEMVTKHRSERQRMKERQAEREVVEQKARMDRLNKGLRGLWDRVTGTHSRVKDRNIRDAMRCLKRDQNQRDELVLTQMMERQGLQEKITEMRYRQAVDRKTMARDVGRVIGRTNDFRGHSNLNRNKERQRKDPLMSR